MLPTPGTLMQLSLISSLFITWEDQSEYQSCFLSYITAQKSRTIIFNVVGCQAPRSKKSRFPVNCNKTEKNQKY